MTTLCKEEYVFLNLLLSQFPYFEGGTIFFNTKLGMDILLCIANAVGKEELDKFFKFNEEEELERKIKRYFTSVNTAYGKERLETCITNNKSKSTILLLKKAIDTMLEVIKHDENIQVLINNIPEKVDYVDGNYIASNVGYCYFYDTTYREGIFVTFLLDAASRVIFPFIITFSQPTRNELVNLLNEAFSSRDSTTKRRLILHSDQAGSNTCLEVNAYCKSKNITISLCRKGTFGNQVIERLNRTFWDCVYSLYYKLDKKRELGFSNQDVDGKIALISHAIYLINHEVKTRKSYVIPKNASPKMTEAALKMYRLSEDKLVKNFTREGLVVRNFIQLAVNLLIQKELMLRVLKKPDSPLLQLPNNVVDAEVMDINKGFDFYKQEADKVNVNNDFMHDLINLTPKGGQSPLEAYREIVAKYNLSIEDQVQAGTISNLAVAQQIKKLSEELTYLRLLREKEERKKEDFIRIKADKKQQRLLNAQKAKNPKFGIYWVDFRPIIKSITGRFVFTAARDRVLHFLLKATGMRIGNLANVNWFQLDRFINGNDMYIIPIKSRNKSIKLECPYYPGLKPYIDMLASDFKVLEAYAFKARENNPSMPSEASEFWGKYGSIKIRYAMVKTNEQLKAAANDVRKASDGLTRRLTSHSYRRGVAIVTNAFFGIVVTQKLMRHVSIVSTMQYVDFRLASKTLKKVFTKGMSVESFEDLPDMNPDDLTRAEYVQGAEEAMEDDNRRLRLDFPDGFGDEKLSDFR